MGTNLLATDQAISTERLISMELRREISRRADSLAEQASELLDGLRDHQKDPLARAQINGLLSVTNTALSIAPIVKFLERQGSRRKEWQQDRLADTLIREVRGLLNEATSIAERMQGRLKTVHKRQDPEIDALTDRRGRLPEIHHLLALEFIQSFALGYLYKYSRE